MDETKLTAKESKNWDGGEVEREDLSEYQVTQVNNTSES